MLLLITGQLTLSQNAAAAAIHEDVVITHGNRSNSLIVALTVDGGKYFL